MAILGICSLKGGVGKTSVTLGLASAAIYAGMRTLVVDLDPQADTTLALGVSGAADNDVAAVLDNPSSFVVESAIASSPWNSELLHVLVGSNESARHDGPSYSHRLTRLKHALEFLEDRYDVILIDCPPSLGGLTRQGLTSCDRALVVTELGLFSVTAAARAFQAIDQIKSESAPQLKPLGVLVNRVRTRSSEQAYRQEELTGMFGPLILSTYIPERSALQQAQGAGSPIHAWPSRAARDLADRFDAVLARAMRSIARDHEIVQEEAEGEELKRAFEEGQQAVQEQNSSSNDDDSVVSEPTVVEDSSVPESTAEAIGDFPVVDDIPVAQAPVGNVPFGGSDEFVEFQPELDPERKQ